LCNNKTEIQGKPFLETIQEFRLLQTNIAIYYIGPQKIGQKFVDFITGHYFVIGFHLSPSGKCLHNYSLQKSEDLLRSMHLKIVPDFPC